MLRIESFIILIFFSSKKKSGFKVKVFVSYFINIINKIVRKKKKLVQNKTVMDSVAIWMADENEPVARITRRILRSRCDILSLSDRM